jgi:fumarate hydratase class II
VRAALPHLCELALGGTAVGTGLNAPAGYAEAVARELADLTGLPWSPRPTSSRPWPAAMRWCMPTVRSKPWRPA